VRNWFEEELEITDCPQDKSVYLQGIINPVSPTLPLIEIELIVVSDQDDEEDIIYTLYQHNPVIGHHEFSLDDVMTKYAPKIAKWREKLSRMNFQDLSQLG
jgi:hypothetical protein